MSIPLEKGILAWFNVHSFGCIVAICGKIGGIACALDDGPEGRTDLLGQKIGEVDAVEVSVVLYIRHS